MRPKVLIALTCLAALVIAAWVVLGRGVPSQVASMEAETESVTQSPIQSGGEQEGDLEVQRGRSLSGGTQTPHQGKAAPILVGVGEMAAEDAKRIAFINSALARAGMAGIPSYATIRMEDLVVLREIVDEAEARVALADEQFLNACVAATDPQRLALIQRLSRNEPPGVAEMGPDNPFRRSHPHEAITQVAYQGKFYVLRVAEWENQEIARTGAALDVERERRFVDYVTMVAPLFSR